MTANKGYSLCKSHGGTADERVLLQNHMICKLNRRDLEDRYYSIWSSNIGLKKKLNAQNEKIKFLNTKLARLTNQQKKDSIISNKCCRDFEDIIEEQSYRIHQLQKLNYNLIEKIELLEVHVNEHSLHSKIPEIILNDGENIEEMLVICEDGERKIANNTDKRSLEPIMENNIEHMEEKIAYLEKEIEILKSDSMQDISKRNLMVDDNLDVDDADSMKDFGVQTEQNDTNKMTDMMQENELLNKKLTEERLKVFELEQKLESNSLKNDILEIVESHINLLNEKSDKNDSNIQNNNVKNTVDEYQELEKQLIESKMNIESLRMVNKQLCSQILEMQSKLDLLTLQNKSNNNQEDNISEELETNLQIEENVTNHPVDEVCETESIHETSNQNTKLRENNETAENSPRENVENQHIVEIHNSDKIDTDVKLKNGEDSKSNSPIKYRLDMDSEQTEDDVKSLEEYQTSICEVKENDLKSESANMQKNHQVDEKMNNVEEADSNSEVLGFNATYDVSTNNSLDYCNSSVNSLSEDYLSEGEIRRADSVINLHRHTSRNTSISNSSNNKTSTDLKGYSKGRDISSSIKSTIEEIAKEREKCKQLLNVKKISSDISFGEIVDFNSFISRSISCKNDLNSIFILNITSVELTEEAMDLIEENLYFLTWKFYKEVVAYTPLCRDRISHFNFSSTYNIVMDDDFISYMSSNNIEIDMHKATDDTSKCFARCKINLFEMFSKINEKVDLILKLEKYPEGRRLHDAESVNYGILRCWCKLTYNNSV